MVTVFTFTCLPHVFLKKIHLFYDLKLFLSEFSGSLTFHEIQWLGMFWNVLAIFGTFGEVF